MVNAQSRPAARKTAKRKTARSTAASEIHVVEPSEARDFRTLAKRFDAIDASNPANGETAVRELSVIAAKTFKCAVDGGLIVGFKADFPWPNPAPFQSQAEVEIGLWAMTWLLLARTACDALSSKSPIDPVAPRWGQPVSHTCQPLDDDVNLKNGRAPATGPCRNTIMAGTVAPEDWRKRATRFASVCLLVADEINGRNSGVAPIKPATESTDDSAFVAAKQIDWQAKLNTTDHKKLHAFLNAQNIQHRNPSSRRLEIHTGDWTRYWAAKEAEARNGGASNQGEREIAEEAAKPRRGVNPDELAFDPEMAQRARAARGKK